MVACQHFHGAASVGATVHNDGLICPVGFQGEGDGLCVPNAWVFMEVVELVDVVLLWLTNVAHVCPFVVGVVRDISIAPQ